MRSLLLFTFCCLCCSCLAEITPITVQNQQGVSLNVVITEITEQSISFRRASDRKLFTVPIDSLDANSQQHAREHWDAYSNTPTESVDTDLEPGSTLTLEFPDLPPMANGLVSKCEIRLPNNYSASSEFPLLVWFSGGKGSHQTNSANGIVDFERFIVAAIPYPNGDLPRLAVNDRSIDRFWDYQKPILEAVIEKKSPTLTQRSALPLATVAAHTWSARHSTANGKGFATTSPHSSFTKVAHQ